jgi:hypothetical protein
VQRIVFDTDENRRCCRRARDPPIDFGKALAVDLSISFAVLHRSERLLQGVLRNLGIREGAGVVLARGIGTSSLCEGELFDPPAVQQPG